ncbi:hypothetical protein [Streptomyces sp. SYSU K21746]
MNKKIAGLTAAGALLAGTVLYNVAFADERDAWCDHTTWIRSASSTYYYLYRNNPQPREKIAKSADYGGWLMTSYQASMDEGRLPHGIEDELQDWSMALQAEIENGCTVASLTDGVLEHCNS